MAGAMPHSSRCSPAFREDGIVDLYRFDKAKRPRRANIHAGGCTQVTAKVAL